MRDKGTVPNELRLRNSGDGVTSVDDTPVPDYQSLMRLGGRRFVLIGAGQGIGRQTAHALSSAGAKVFCIDVDPDLAAEIAEEVDGVAGTGDATVRADAERLFEEAQVSMGGLDGLVDIVGAAVVGDITGFTDEQWNGQFDLCLRHAFLAMQLGGRALSQGGGGAMVFVASVSGFTGAPRHAVYGAAKAGLMSLVRSGAVELGPSNIRVNAVAPGLVWTPRVSKQLGDAGHATYSANSPLGRVAQPSNVASVILFLASDLASYVTGQTLIADGGVSVKLPYPWTL